MDTEFKNFKWATATKFEDASFDAKDFTGADFDGVLFVNCEFSGCLFKRGNPGSLGFFGCDFTDCTFESFDFRHISVGADGGTFTRCKLLKCNFAGRHFEYPHFDECTFDHCKIKGVNFNDSSFRRCVFVGKLEDTTFNGLYHRKATGFRILDEVDFTQANLGDFVTFENCDLSNSKPPAGRTFAELLYQIYANHPTILSTGSADRIVLTRR